MRVQSAVATLVVLSLFVAGACSTKSDSGKPNGSGGAPSSGGAPASAGAATAGQPGGGAGGSCSNVTACGGDVVGAWTVSSSCLQVAGQLDLSGTSVGCASAPATGELHVTG